MLGKPLARHEDIVFQESGSELLIYDLKINKAFCLNETSALVWQLCDGKNSVSEISDKLSAQLRTLVSEDLVWLALDQFSKDGLLDDMSTTIHFKGLSRREVIRRVGFVSVIALPAVSVILAPNSAAAQSCLAPRTAIPFPFTNPSTQPSVADCTAYCFDPDNPSNTEPSCCSGIGRSEGTFYFFPTNACTCVNYQCEAS